MRDPKRIKKLMKKLRKVWKEGYPDLRFFQFMQHFMAHVQSYAPYCDLFYVEDKETEKYLDEIIANLKKAKKRGSLI